METMLALIILSMLRVGAPLAVLLGLGILLERRHLAGR